MASRASPAWKYVLSEFAPSGKYIITLALPDTGIFVTQYFYTIKDLRKALASGSFERSVIVPEEEFKRKPIGGRLITERELDRSRKCENAVDLCFSLASMN